MKAIILAAGYGTRLQRDMVADGRFPHLVGTAKPLLPVGRCALISHWVRALTASGVVDRIYVVTNALHLEAFEEWACPFSNVSVLSDQTTNNEQRLGAVACLQLTVKHFRVDDHVLVIGGDTLFREDFSLRSVQQRFEELQALRDDSCLVLSYRCRDDETHKYGILETDADLRVVAMKEKPLPAETASRSACPCFYVLSQKSLPQLDVFLEEMKELPVQEKDAPGTFVSWLIPRTPVFSHQVSGRFDVGGLSSFLECDRYFREKLQDSDLFLL